MAEAETATVAEEEETIPLTDDAIVDEEEEFVAAPWEDGGGATDAAEVTSMADSDVEIATLEAQADEALEALEAIQAEIRERVAAAKQRPPLASREYRLELFEEGDNRVFGRQRSLAREGWDFPAIHGFERQLTGNRGVDRFLIVVASRDVEATA